MDVGQDRGCRRLWATVAQFLVVIGWLGLLGTQIDYGRLSWRVAQVMTGQLYAEYNVKIIDDTDIYLQGYINYDAVDEIRELIRANENITTLVINSPGGFIGASVELGSLVEQNELIVAVDGQCLSGCTLSLVASPAPTIIPGAVVG